MNVYEALKVVVDEAADEYAKTYAQAALELGDSKDAVIVEKDNPGSGLSFAIDIAHKKTGNVMIGKELKVQILYVLSNLSYWRGERAREIKAVLKNAVMK